MKQEAEAPVLTAWVDVADCDESRASPIQLVKQLLERLNDQSEQLALQEGRLALQDELIQQLKDEIARLKGEKGRPQIKPSTLEKQSRPRDNDGGAERDGEAGRGKRPGSAKRKKTKELAIHETQVLPPKHLAPGSVFKGDQDYVVQGIRIIPCNTKFRLERWLKKVLFVWPFLVFLYSFRGSITRPVSSLPLASYSPYGAGTQRSLLACWLGFGQMGLEPPRLSPIGSQ